MLVRRGQGLVREPQSLVMHSLGPGLLDVRRAARGDATVQGLVRLSTRAHAPHHRRAHITLLRARTHTKSLSHTSRFPPHAQTHAHTTSAHNRVFSHALNRVEQIAGKSVVTAGAWQRCTGAVAAQQPKALGPVGRGAAAARVVGNCPPRTLASTAPAPARRTESTLPSRVKHDARSPPGAACPSHISPLPEDLQDVCHPRPWVSRREGGLIPERCARRTGALRLRVAAQAQAPCHARDCKPSPFRMQHRSGVTGGRGRALPQWGAWSAPSLSRRPSLKPPRWKRGSLTYGSDVLLHPPPPAQKPGLLQGDRAMWEPGGADATIARSKQHEYTSILSRYRDVLCDLRGWFFLQHSTSSACASSGFL